MQKIWRVFVIITLLAGLGRCSAQETSWQGWGATLPPSLARTPQAAEAAAKATIAAAEAQKRELEVAIAEAQATQAAASTATAQAWALTATAQAGATQEAIAQATSTAQALALAGTATMQALQVVGTGTAQARHLMVAGTSTAQAVSATATAVSALAEKTRVDLEVRKRMSWAWAVTPWLAVVLLIGAFLWTVRQAVRTWVALRVVRKDPQGDAPLLVLPGGDVVDMDRNPWPILPVDKGGHGRMLPTSEPMQEGTVYRDQMVDLHRSSAGRPVLSAGQRSPVPPGRVVVRVLPPNEVRWLEEVEERLALEVQDEGREDIAP